MYSTESIVQDALDELQSISQKLSDFFLDWELDALLDLLEWRRWFYLWGRKWGDEQDVDWETAVCTVEETLHRHSLETPFLCLTLKEKLLWVDDSDERWEDDSEGWDDVLKDFLRRFIRSVQPGIEELGRMLGTDLTLQTRSSSRTDVKQLLDSVDFILHTFQSLEHQIANANETITFMKNFIRFATLHGLEDRQIIGDLLTHFERVVIQSASLLVRVGEGFLSLTSRCEILRNIQPVESRVCEIYVGVLQDVSKFSGSSFHPTKETHALVFRDFVDSLIFLILNLFFRGAIFVDMFPHEMHKVHEGLSFLRTISEHHEKLDDLIRPLICEAGILIFHLYQENGEQRGRLVAKLELLFSNFETKLQILKAAEEDAPRFPPTSAYPQTNLLGFIDSVLEKIKSFLIQVSSEKDKFQALHDDLTVLRSFVVHDNGMTNQDLSSRIAAVAYDTEFVLDSLVVAGKPLQTSLIVQLDVIITEIELIKTQVSEIPWSMEPTIALQEISQANLKMAPAVGKIPDSNERVVGFDDEAKIIIDRLTRGTKQLDVVSIVGMVGLGKTSLAKKVYHHSHISHHFQARSWLTVSQEYNTKSLLIAILSGLDQNSTGAYIINMREDDLAERLRKRLKGIRYLIILDDIWDTQVWNSLKMSFPDDDKGSRILLTSRQETIGLEINPHSEPHHLRALNDDESWELFRKKMCFDQSCPSEEVIARAKTIAKSCKGLPLMILIVAGFLANTEPSKWEEVEEMLKTGSAMAADQCMETLELSYRHLPNHLKPCFLYLGAFEEDQSIPVRQILRLWIAEGFVQETAGREFLEDVAKGYMMELVQRNLVMVAQRDFRGQTQQCVLHDLVRDFAIARSKKEHFMHRVHGHELNGCVEASQPYRLTIDLSGAEKFSESRSLYPRLRTLLFVTKPKVYPQTTSLYKFFQFKLIRVLVLSRLFWFDTFPCVILLLVQLKYLAFTVYFDSEIIIPSSILNLSDLETLIVDNARVLLPDTLWGMKKLRHLDGAREFVLPSEIPVANLENLQTFSIVTFTCSQTMVGVVKKLPNLRTLRCRLDLGGGECTVDFITLNQLESLFINTSRGTNLFQFRFPQNLKDLSLYSTCLQWSEVSAIGRLPNLEALRLDWNEYEGENWDIEEEGTFPKLRVLELYNMMSLERWTTASDDDFPSIETLILGGCRRLKEIPSCIAQSSTLQMIKVRDCPRVFDSIKEIHETQMDYGNEDLQIYLDKKQLTKENYEVIQSRYNSDESSFESVTTAKPSSTQDKPGKFSVFPNTKLSMLYHIYINATLMETYSPGVAYGSTYCSSNLQC
ncbi:OLC1v1012406C1 [Oldenlandia corymbosa var. corymbosa]|uniref:OLC1v1012406C1 n=1 Tax=Oldenlandia corymbosa var. corymbosa TaxID=529605 RepID=A0AAV1DY10_OLDCO|nr:OLC1v1012406C1 [Oldenlandia corymbosa var. corymbosa]